MVKNGSAFEKVTRNMVENLQREVRVGFKDIKSSLNTINNNQTELFNHQSSRLPHWATLAFTIGGSLITGLIIWAVSH